MKTRRQFLMTAGLTGIALIATACGSNSSYGSGGGGGAAGTGAGPSSGQSDQNCTDGADVTYTNPGHAHTPVAMTPAQLAASTAGIYQLLTGSHTHTFSLSAADFVQLQAGQAVQKGDLEGHGHIIQINC